MSKLTLTTALLLCIPMSLAGAADNGRAVASGRATDLSKSQGGYYGRMDHSKKFWKLVAAACPDYQSARRWLREHGRSI